MLRDEVTGSLLKKMGLKKGFPDYVIFDRPPDTDYAGLVFDMKRRKGGRLSEFQRPWLEAMAKLGWLGASIDGSQQAVAFISRLYKIPTSYNFPPVQVELFR